MIKEFIQVHTKETVFKVQGSKINAIRNKDIFKKGVRVYQDNKIGISGAVGDIDESVLVEEAVDNLRANILYPYEPTTGVIDHRCYNDSPMTSEELQESAESIMEVLEREYDGFDFSQNIGITEQIISIKNTEGLDLEYKDAYFDIGLLVKEKKSGNIMDGFIGFQSRTFDRERFWEFNRGYLEAYKTKAELPEGDKIPVFTFSVDELGVFLAEQLNGENYATKSSIFADKMNQKLFNEKLNILQDADSRYSYRPFFDAEGAIPSIEQSTLIRDGIFVQVATDKKTAADYDLPHTCAARGEYDERPNINNIPLRFKTDSKDIKGVLNGQLAVLVYFASGGDFTTEGSYASPVQVSFLFDGEKILGKLDGFTISSHVYDMLGDDYIGTFECEHIYMGDDTRLQGYYMKVIK